MGNAKLQLIYQRRLVPKRLRPSTRGKTDIDSAARSDRSRILYSAPFRRLQQKAQVFSLESNAFVRSRLTHSLEVADVGRAVAKKVAAEVFTQGSGKKVLSESQLVELRAAFVDTVESACLLHDIGNPPFGHFGEAAIRKWFAEYGEEICLRSLNSKSRTKSDSSEVVKLSEHMRYLLRDFSEFDGNPQGFRTVARTQSEVGYAGLNLIFPTLLAFLKYTRSPFRDSQSVGKGLTKKAGYFQTEESIIGKALKATGTQEGCRFPLAYIMEAADDIAYCISDLEDGIEKGLLNEDQLLESLAKQWRSSPALKSSDIAAKLIASFEEPSDDQRRAGIVKFLALKTTFTRLMIDEAARLYLEQHDEIMEGELASLFPEGSEVPEILSTLKFVARKSLFVADEAEEIELAGFAAISGILKHYRPLLELSREDFDRLIESETKPGSRKGLDVEWRLYNRLSKKCRRAYEREAWVPGTNDETEWHLRAHLVVDHIAGMTDHFALEFYQLLSGIQVH